MLGHCFGEERKSSTGRVWLRPTASTGPKSVLEQMGAFSMYVCMEVM